MSHETHNHLSGGGSLTPCTPMRTLLSRLADGTLSSGPAHWVVTRHIENCPGCAEALAALQMLSHRLRALGQADFTEGATVFSVVSASSHSKGAPDALTLSPDRWDAVLIAWETADAHDAH